MALAHAVGGQVGDIKRRPSTAPPDGRIGVVLQHTSCKRARQGRGCGLPVNGNAATRVQRWCCRDRRPPTPPPPPPPPPWAPLGAGGPPGKPGPGIRPPNRAGGAQRTSGERRWTPSPCPESRSLRHPPT